MDTTYRVTVNGAERLRFRADFTTAASPIRVLDELGCPWVTAFQVGDARHKPTIAAERINNWFRAQNRSLAWAEDETPEIVAEEA